MIMTLRKHQKELQQIVDDIIAGSSTKTVICEITHRGRLQAQEKDGSSKHKDKHKNNNM